MSLPIIVTNRSAGFGSNFLQALDWYWYAEDTGVPVYIDWQESGRNVFEDLFEQIPRPTGNVFTTNTYYNAGSLSDPKIDELRFQRMPIYKKYNRFLFSIPGLYHEPTLPDIRLFFNSLMSKNLKLKSPTPYLNLSDALGVHMRFMGHFYTDFGPTNPLSNVMSQSEFYSKNLEQIKSKLVSFDKFYLACDDNTFFNMCINIPNAIYQKYSRTDGDWMFKRKTLSGENWLAMNDILNLSRCKEMMGCVSNFTFTTLVMNPSLKFQLFDTVKNVYTG